MTSEHDDQRPSRKLASFSALPQDLSCTQCPHRRSCLPALIEDTHVDGFDQIVRSRRILHRGDSLFRQLDECHSLFAVRSGSFKLTTLSEHGDDQVLGFFFPASILGSEGISRGIHSSSAIALETAAVCEIPFEALCTSSANLPGLQRNFFRFMSQEISNEQHQIRLLGRCTAPQRLATFLLDLSEHFQQRGLSPRRFTLPMSRGDIASYLGLSVETVSRVLGSFLQRDLISLESRQDIELLQQPALQRIAGGSE